MTSLNKTSDTTRTRLLAWLRPAPAQSWDRRELRNVVEVSHRGVGLPAPPASRRGVVLFIYEHTLIAEFLTGVRPARGDGLCRFDISLRARRAPLTTTTPAARPAPIDVAACCKARTIFVSDRQPEKGLVGRQSLVMSTRQRHNDVNATRTKHGRCPCHAFPAPSTSPAYILY